MTHDGVFVSHACQSTSGYSLLSGTLLWQTWAVGCASGGGSWMPVASSGLVYARQSDTDDEYFTDMFDPYVLNASTGADAGTFETGPPPAIHAGHMFVVRRVILSSVSIGDQSVSWTFGDGTLTTPPIVVSGRVFIGSSTGTLYALDEATGSSTWSDLAGAGFSELQEGSGGIEPTALGAADGLLVAPVGSSLVVYGAEADGGVSDAGGDGE